MLNVNNSNSRIALSTSVNFQDKILGENITKKTKVPSKNFQKVVKIVTFIPTNLKNLDNIWALKMSSYLYPLGNRHKIKSEYIIKMYRNPNSSNWINGIQFRVPVGTNTGNTWSILELDGNTAVSKRPAIEMTRMEIALVRKWNFS